jgi:hypothetical protein
MKEGVEMSSSLEIKAACDKSVKVVCEQTQHERRKSRAAKDSKGAAYKSRKRPL